MILLTPGPTPVPPEALRAMAQPILHHRSEEFRALQAACDGALTRIFRTSGPVLTLAGSGTSAFEAALLSLAPPGGTVVTCVNGRFGARWRTAAQRIGRWTGLRVESVEAAWGEPILPQLLAEALHKTPHAAAVMCVHCETSTGAVSDVRGLAEVARHIAPSAMVIVDGVSSVGAVPIEAGKWGIDALVSGSQKALMMAPGLGFVGLSERAAARLAETTDDAIAAPLSLDLRVHLQGYAAQAPPYTPAVGLIAGLRAALSIIEERGVERVWEETAARAAAVRAACAAMGLTLATSAPGDPLTVIDIPGGLAEEARRLCRERHGVLFAGGQDDWAGRILRFSHMGWVSTEETRAGVAALGAGLAEAGLFSESVIQQGLTGFDLHLGGV